MGTIHFLTDMNLTLDQVTYEHKSVHDMILKSFYEIEFVGVRGYTKFGPSGDPYGLIEIKQQQGKEVQSELARKLVNQLLISIKYIKFVNVETEFVILLYYNLCMYMIFTAI